MFGIDPKEWLDAASDAVEGTLDAVGGALEDAAEATGQVIEDVSEAAEDFVEGTVEFAEDVAEGAAEFAEDVAEGAAEFAEVAVERGGDVLVTGLHTAGAIGHGAVQTAVEAWEDSGDAVGAFLEGDFEEGFETVGKIAFDVTARAAFDAVAVAAVGTISAGQTLLGLEDPGRPLTDDEIAELREVYGDSIDYENVRVKENVGGILGGSGRPFTVGNTIYVPGEGMTDDTLVHEVGHVWQFQNGGTDYISDALMGRYLPGGEGYNLGLGLERGAAWSELNPEQQSELIEELYDNGYFDEPAEGAGEKRVLIVVNEDASNPDAGGGYDLIVVEEGSEAYEAAVAAGYSDVTEDVEAAEEAWRAGEGAA